METGQDVVDRPSTQAERRAVGQQSADNLKTAIIQPPQVFCTLAQLNALCVNAFVAAMVDKAKQTRSETSAAVWGINVKLH